MATTGSLKFWFLLLPDDVIRQILSEFLYLSDLVRFDTALCHHQFRAEYLSLLPSLKLEFSHDMLRVLGFRLQNEMFTKQIFYSAENPTPTSATIQQFQFVHRRGITVPEIYIQARMSKSDMMQWSSVLAKVQKIKLEPNETERFRSKTLLRFLRSLSFYLYNIRAFELIPFWSLYRYTDDVSSDASGAEELDSELSLDFADDTLSSVDGSVLEDDSQSTSRSAPPISKTLLNILILYFPNLQHIKVQSIDGLESVHLTQPSMVSVWTNLRTLHLEHITFFLQTYNALFASLASHAMVLENLLISMPRGDISRAIITPEVFLSPLESIVPVSSNALRNLQHLSGDFLLIYPIYFYLCGNSQCLQSMDVLFRSKPVEQFMLQKALQNHSHLFRTTDYLPTASFNSFTFDAVPRILNLQVQEMLMNWMQATIITPFVQNMKVFHVHGLYFNHIHSATAATAECFLPFISHKLESLQCGLSSWMSSTAHRDNFSSSSSSYVLKRLCLSPWVPSRFPLTQNVPSQASFLQSLLPWKDTLQELRLIQPHGFTASTFMRTISISSLELFGSLESSLQDTSNVPTSWIFPALSTIQFISQSTSRQEAIQILLRFLPLVPALNNLDISHWLPSSRTIHSEAEFTYVLTEEVLNIMINRNIHLRYVALPPSIETETPQVARAIATLFYHIYPLKMISILHFLDSQLMTVDVPHSLVVDKVNCFLKDYQEHGDEFIANQSPQMKELNKNKHKRIWCLDTRALTTTEIEQDQYKAKSFIVEADGMKPSIVLCSM